MVTVGAVDQGDIRPEWSNWGGGGVDVFAPGTEVLSAWIGGDGRGKAVAGGTSMGEYFICLSCVMMFGCLCE